MNQSIKQLINTTRLILVPVREIVHLVGPIFPVPTTKITIKIFSSILKDGVSTAAQNLLKNLLVIFTSLVFELALSRYNAY